MITFYGILSKENPNILQGVFYDLDDARDAVIWSDNSDFYVVELY